MDAPPVQYATTSDGVSIAWLEAGEGPALLYCGGGPFSHVQDLFALAEVFFGALARSLRLIMFDARGTGMSERDVNEVSTATLLRDAEAVIGAARLDRFAVLGDMSLLAASTALDVALAFQDRATHLILEQPWQRMSDLADTPYGRVNLVLAEADWDVYLKTAARVLFGLDPVDTPWLDPFAQAMGGWVDRSVGLQYLRLQEATDVGDLLGRVRQPALVMRNDPSPVPARVCQRIAARIPGAMFRQYADPTFAQQAALVLEFLGQSPTAPAEIVPTASGTAVILFTDIVSSTELTERLGDTRFREASRALDAGLRDAIRDRRGSDRREAAGRRRPRDVPVSSAGDRRRSTLPRPQRRVGAGPAHRSARRRRDPGGEQRVRRRGEHRRADLRAIGAGRDPGIGRRARHGAVVGRRGVCGPRRARDEGRRRAGARVRGAGGEMSIEPQIRYATTSDGVSIAYWIMGEGPPLFVSSPLTFSHTGLELRIPAIAAFYERIARDAMLVRWDPRNYGMSQRGVERLGVEDWARDVTAVADSLHLDEFDLLAINRAHPAAALAARQPCRIRRLVLAGAAPVRLADLFADENQVAVRSLAGTNWRVYTETLAHFLQGWEPHPDLPYARFMRESIDQADYLRVMAAWREWDATPYLPNVSCPTLVVSAGDNSKHARMYAAAIPGARFLDVEVAHPNALQPNLNYTAAILSSRNAAIEEFFREGADGARRTSTRDRVRTPETHATGTAVIMFTDIVSSTELTERLGDVTFREASRALDAGLRDAIHDAGGTAIDGKLLGDGVLATFPSAAQAIGGARRCLALSAASELGLHIGLHAGDVIREENNVFGGAVNIASRICGLSAPGEILVSDVVRGMARSSAGVEFADRGEQEMKGVGEPVRVYAVRGSV